MTRKFLALAALASTLGFAQKFDAASVRPASPSAGPFSRTIGGPGTRDPGRIRYSNISLKALMLTAYGIHDYQISGPAWMDTDRFDIDATMPADATRGQFQEMLRNLLAERFKLEVHRETKDAPAYTLAAAKNGPKMSEAAPASTAPETPPGSIERDRDGFPKLPAGGPPGMMQFVLGSRARLTGRQQTTADLAARLADILGRPVTDATGLSAKYDFTVTFAAEGTTLTRMPMLAMPPGLEMPAETEPAPSLASALESQLGLKLEARRAPMEVIVIDRVERTPVAN